MKLALHFIDGKTTVTDIGDNLHMAQSGDLFEILRKCIETNGPVKIMNNDGTEVLYQREFKDLKSIELILK